MKQFIFGSFCLVLGLLSLAAPRAEAATADSPAQAGWSVLSAGVANDEFNQISCPEPLTCYATAGLYLIGGSGGIVKTTDGGATFSSPVLPSSDPLHSISCPSVNVCFAAGDFGTVLKTEDGGETWLAILLGSKSNRPQFTSIFALDKNQVIVVGKDGVIYRTIDGGASWAPPPLRIFADFFDVYFVDSSTGFITGNGGTLLKTTDGGVSWKPTGTLKNVGLVLAIRGSDMKTLYAVGDSLLKSTDGGETWSTLNAGAGQAFRAVAVPDGQTAYLVSESNAILKTTDGGASWNTDFSLPSTVVRAVACPTSNYCIAVGGLGKAFRLGTPPLPPPPPPTATVIATTTPLVAATTTPLVAAVAVAVETTEPAIVLNRTLKKGSRGEDVKQLQDLLAAVGFFSQKERTTSFGPATMKAVGAFQVKYKIVGAGKAGYGEAGPKTRKKLIEAATLRRP